MKNLLYIIDSLGVGGAEKLLVDTILASPEYLKITVVYLYKPHTLVPLLNGTEVIFLNLQGYLHKISAVTRLRNIIVSHKIDIVHAHLFWSTILARLACPKNVKLFFSVHSIISSDVFRGNKLLSILEKVTYLQRHTAIFVSNTVKEDYIIHVGLKGPSYVLYNFVEEEFYLKRKERLREFNGLSQMRLVSVGNLKPSKNYQLLINIFRNLKSEPITLDIFGEGYYSNHLRKMLTQNQIVNIKLKGQHLKIFEVLADYDIFIMPSENEGFCIAVAEAMASGLPCILADIKTFREISGNNALFFSLRKPQELFNYLKNIKELSYQLKENASKASVLAENFRIKRYMEELQKIYYANVFGSVDRSV